jgi:CHASE2 domain-containing sensor protein
MGLGIAKSVKTLLENPFWQRALPVLAVVLSFNVIVKLDWIREELPFVTRWQYAFHRGLASVYPRELKARVVKAVEIDTALHQQLGEPATNRKYIATLVENAAKGHAAVVVLDFKLVVPEGKAEGSDAEERKEQNAKLLEAVENATQAGTEVVVPCWLAPTAGHHQFVRRPSIFRDSELPLARDKKETGTLGKPEALCGKPACATLGNINLPIDKRQLPLLAEMPSDDPCAESLSLAAVSAYEERTGIFPRTREYHKIEQAIEEKEFVFGSFLPEDRFPKIAASALAEGNEATERSCLGQIIVIGGNWRADFGRGERVDAYDTPAGTMAGMYLHANYIEALLDERYQKEVPLWLGLVLDLVVGAGLYICFHRANTSRGKLRILALFFVPLAASYIAVANAGFYLDFILPLLGCFVHLGVEFARDYVHLRKAETAY